MLTSSGQSTSCYLPIESIQWTIIVIMLRSSEKFSVDSYHCHVNFQQNFTSWESSHACIAGSEPIAITTRMTLTSGHQEQANHSQYIKQERGRKIWQEKNSESIDECWGLDPEWINLPQRGEETEKKMLHVKEKGDFRENNWKENNAQPNTYPVLWTTT